MHCEAFEIIPCNQMNTCMLEHNSSNFLANSLNVNYFLLCCDALKMLYCNMNNKSLDNIMLTHV